MLYLTHCVEKCCRLRYLFKSINILRHSAVAVVQITVCDKIQHVRQLVKSPFATKSNMCNICPCESCKGCCDNPSLSKSAVCGVCFAQFLSFALFPDLSTFAVYAVYSIPNLTFLQYAQLPGLSKSCVYVISAMPLFSQEIRNSVSTAYEVIVLWRQLSCGVWVKHLQIQQFPVT